MIIHRKFAWLMILMVWVGMVTSIIVYQGNEHLVDSRQATSGEIEIVEESKSGSKDDIDFTQSKAENDSGGKDFFIEYRIERDKARSEQIDIYRGMINNPNTGEATKKEAQEKMLQLTEKVEKEMEIESLIRARGYKDALAYIHDEAVDVIIQTGGLDKNDVARVGDIIAKTTGFNFEDVTIIEKKIENEG